MIIYSVIIKRALVYIVLIYYKMFYIFLYIIKYKFHFDPVKMKFII